MLVSFQYGGLLGSFALTAKGFKKLFQHSKACLRLATKGKFINAARNKVSGKACNAAGAVKRKELL